MPIRRLTDPAASAAAYMEKENDCFRALQSVPRVPTKV